MRRSLTFILLFVFSAAAIAKPFSFVALGDTAYNLPDDLPRYEKLIDAINKDKPEFTIHVGDTWGALPCTQENHEWIKGWFNKYDHPVVYTPGDNEWTDCRKPEILEAYLRIVGKTATQADYQMIGKARQFDNGLAGTSFADTLQSLDTIRNTFFGEPISLGAKTMPVVRQSDVSDYDEMKENVRWMKDEVMFGTAHVPGSGMNFTINDPVRANDAMKRHKAVVEWIKDLFLQAEKEEAKAVVLAIHASLFIAGEGSEFSGAKLRGNEEGAYYWIALAIRDFANQFGKPVLLINGDFHEFIIDRPFAVSQGEAEPPLYGNITRLQVYGAPELRSVKVTVDTDTPWVFSFSPLWVE